MKINYNVNLEMSVGNINKDGVSVDGIRISMPVSGNIEFDLNEMKQMHSYAGELRRELPAAFAETITACGNAIREQASEWLSVKAERDELDRTNHLAQEKMLLDVQTMHHKFQQTGKA